MNIRNMGFDPANLKEVDKAVWIPLVASVAFILVFMLVYWTLEIGKLSSLAANLASNFSVETLPVHAWRKLLFGTSLVALTSILLWNVIAQILIARNQFPKFPNVAITIVNVVAAFVSFAIIVVIVIYGFGGKLTGFFLENMPEGVNNYILVNNILAGVAICAAIICSCVLAHPISKGRDAIQAVRMRTKLFLISIYSASALLAIAIIEIYFLYTWISHLIDPYENGSIQQLVNIMTVGAGVCFSILLIVIYLPTGFFLNRIQNNLEIAATRKAEKEGNSDFALDEWRTIHKLPKLAVSFKTNLAAIVIPMITGILPILLP